MITQQEIIERYPKATPEEAEKIAEAMNKSGTNFEQFETAVKTLTRIAVAALEIARGIAESIRTQATPKELHLMLHAKKRRTRKKYANRIAKRAAALITKGGTT